MFSGDYEPVNPETPESQTGIPFRKNSSCESESNPSVGPDEEAESEERRSGGDDDGAGNGDSAGDGSERDAVGVPPRELTPDLPPRPDNRLRSTNQRPGYAARTPGEVPGRRLGAFAVGASRRLSRQPKRPPSPESPVGR